MTLWIYLGAAPSGGNLISAGGMSAERSVAGMVTTAVPQDSGAMEPGGL